MSTATRTIGVSGQNLLVTHSDGSDGFHGAGTDISRLAMDTGTVSTLASGIRSMIVASGNVFYDREVNFQPGSGTLWRVPASGGSPQKLGVGQSLIFAADSSAVYFATIRYETQSGVEQPGALMKVALSSGAATVLASGPDTYFHKLQVRDSGVYYVIQRGPYNAVQWSIQQIPLAGGPVKTLLKLPPKTFFEQMTVRGTEIQITKSPDRQVLSTNGGALRTLPRGGKAPCGFNGSGNNDTLDGYFYFGGDDGLRRCKLGSTSEETVVTGLRVNALFIDERRVFFVAPDPAKAAEYLILRHDPKS